MCACLHAHTPTAFAYTLPHCFTTLREKVRGPPACLPFVFVFHCTTCIVYCQPTNCPSINPHHSRAADLLGLSIVQIQGSSLSLAPFPPIPGPLVNLWPPITLFTLLSFSRAHTDSRFKPTPLPRRSINAKSPCTLAKPCTLLTNHLVHGGIVIPALLLFFCNSFNASPGFHPLQALGVPSAGSLRITRPAASSASRSASWDPGRRQRGERGGAKAKRCGLAAQVAGVQVCGEARAGGLSRA